MPAAFAVFDEMKRFGVVADGVTYGAMIAACKDNGGRVDDAILLFFEMRDAGA